MNGFVPRLQLNPSRTASRQGGDGEAVPWLNRTAAPVHTTNSSSNHTTFMTNNTMNSDAYNEGLSSTLNGGGSSGVAAPPSPAPRVGGRVHGVSNAWPDQQQQRQQQWRYTDPMASGRRSSPGPSATRPLFTSASASSSRDVNMWAGDTGRAPLWGSSSNEREAPFFTSRPLQANAFTSTYVGNASGAMPAGKSGYTFRGGGGGVGLGVSDADWQGGREGASGLVSSRSRVRADRWTDEGLTDAPGEDAYEGYGDGGAASLDGATTLPSTASSSASSVSYEGDRRRRHRRSSSRKNGGHRRDLMDEVAAAEGDGSDVDSDDLWDAGEGEDGGAPLSFADAVVRAMDAQPVVPLELLRKAQEAPFLWVRHPSHGIVLSLLQHRGIYLPRYRELVDYHMAELFLHYLDLCREGAYFVHYAPSKWPKERFFRIRMLPVNRLEAGTEPVPHLVVTLHEAGVHILDAIPLDNLVGVTVSPQSACFRPFLESPNTIIGCREGRGHRARMPVDGAFSLWFYDLRQHTSRSVDMLTCDAKVFDIWTKTFRGLVSVNSSSVVQVAMTAQGESADLARLTQEAQEQGEIDHGERKGKFADS